MHYVYAYREKWSINHSRIVISYRGWVPFLSVHVTAHQTIEATVFAWYGDYDMGTHVNKPSSYLIEF